MYYENFDLLCKKNNVKPSDVSKSTQISTATLSSWKKGTYTPKQDKLQKIADYFKVSVDYLMTGEMPEEDFSDESVHLIAEIRKDIELSNALKKYFGLSDIKKKHVIELINFLSEWGLLCYQKN